MFKRLAQTQAYLIETICLFHVSRVLTCQRGVSFGLLFAPRGNEHSNEFMTSVQEEVHCQLYAPT